MVQPRSHGAAPAPAFKLPVLTQPTCFTALHTPVRSTRKQSEADRDWFCVDADPTLRQLDHVITTVELGNIFKVGRGAGGGRAGRYDSGLKGCSHHHQKAHPARKCESNASRSSSTPRSLALL